MNETMDSHKNVDSEFSSSPIAKNEKDLEAGTENKNDFNYRIINEMNDTTDPHKNIASEFSSFPITKKKNHLETNDLKNINCIIINEMNVTTNTHKNIDSDSRSPIAKKENHLETETVNRDDFKNTGNSLMLHTEATTTIENLPSINHNNNIRSRRRKSDITRKFLCPKEAPPFNAKERENEALLTEPKEGVNGAEEENEQYYISPPLTDYTHAFRDERNKHEEDKDVESEYDNNGESYSHSGCESLEELNYEEFNDNTQDFGSDEKVMHDKTNISSFLSPYSFAAQGEDFKNGSVNSNGFNNQNLTASHKRGYYKAYTREQLMKALEAVQTAKMSGEQAAKFFKVPRSTLHHHLRPMQYWCVYCQTDLRYKIEWKEHMTTHKKKIGGASLGNNNNHQIKNEIQSSHSDESPAAELNGIIAVNDQNTTSKLTITDNFENYNPDQLELPKNAPSTKPFPYHSTSNSLPKLKFNSDDEGDNCVARKSPMTKDNVTITYPISQPNKYPNSSPSPVSCATNSTLSYYGNYNGIQSTNNTKSKQEPIDRLTTSKNHSDNYEPRTDTLRNYLMKGKSNEETSATGISLRKNDKSILTQGFDKKFEKITLSSEQPLSLRKIRNALNNDNHKPTEHVSPDFVCALCGLALGDKNVFLNHLFVHNQIFLASHVNSLEGDNSSGYSMVGGSLSSSDMVKNIQKMGCDIVTKMNMLYDGIDDKFWGNLLDHESSTDNAASRFNKEPFPVPVESAQRLACDQWKYKKKLALNNFNDKNSNMASDNELTNNFNILNKNMIENEVVMAALFSVAYKYTDIKGASKYFKIPEDKLQEFYQTFSMGNMTKYGIGGELAPNNQFNYLGFDKNVFSPKQPSYVCDKSLGYYDKPNNPELQNSHPEDRIINSNFINKVGNLSNKESNETLDSAHMKFVNSHSYRNDITKKQSKYTKSQLQNITTGSNGYSMMGGSSTSSDTVKNIQKIGCDIVTKMNTLYDGIDNKFWGNLLQRESSTNDVAYNFDKDVSPPLPVESAERLYDQWVNNKKLALNNFNDKNSSNMASNNELTNNLKLNNNNMIENEVVMAALFSVAYKYIDIKGASKYFKIPEDKLQKYYQTFCMGNMTEFDIEEHAPNNLLNNLGFDKTICSFKQPPYIYNKSLNYLEKTDNSELDSIPKDTNNNFVNKAGNKSSSVIPSLAHKRFMNSHSSKKDMAKKQSSKYTKSQLKSAISTVIHGQKTVVQASKIYGIPYRTLYDYIRNYKSTPDIFNDDFEEDFNIKNEEDKVVKYINSDIHSNENTDRFYDHKGAPTDNNQLSENIKHNNVDKNNDVEEKLPMLNKNEQFVSSSSKGEEPDFMTPEDVINNNCVSPNKRKAKWPSKLPSTTIIKMEATEEPDQKVTHLPSSENTTTRNADNVKSISTVNANIHKEMDGDGIDAESHDLNQDVAIGNDQSLNGEICNKVLFKKKKFPCRSYLYKNISKRVKINHDTKRTD
ncbi:unnamed protein product [Gordionus sp. m RMFG-2023]|uniref:uncharacterized protein LOC135922547 isoform X2 n=1 Tax=Gordionus sp. m RMFG-2023 TaxID=3053472 RepID=UPI0030E066F4